MSGIKFVLADQQVTLGGYRALVAGANLKQFRANPVMLFNHDRSRLPIGHWQNIRVEGETITAEPVFDENDAFAQVIRQKVEGGHLRAASIGFNPEAISEDPKYLLKGQTRPTITKLMVMEASITDLPLNLGALKCAMFTQTGEEMDLDKTLPLLKQTTQKKMISKTILAQLGLSEDSDEAAVGAAIEKMKGQIAQSAAAEVPAQPVTQAAPAGETDIQKQINELKGLVAELGKNIQRSGSLSETINQSANVVQIGGSDGRKDWDYTKWSKQDPDGLLQMKNTNATEYNRLVEAYHP